MKNILLSAVVMMTVATTTMAQFPSFSDVIASSGLNPSQGFILDILDYNNDGFDDLIYKNGTTAFKLMKNNGNGSFTDNTSISGIPNNVLWKKSISTDFDNDGLIDLLTWDNGSFRFFINSSNFQFSEKTTTFGITNPIFSSGVHINEDAILLSDYDKDGDNDIILVLKENNNNRKISVLKNDLSISGNFNLVVDLINGIPSTLDPVVACIDYDGDLDDDIIVNMKLNSGGPVGSGGFFTLNPVKIFQNESSIFTDVTSNTGLSNLYTSHFGFINVVDLNYDGLMDILIGTTDATYPNYTNNKNRYLKNNGNGTFTDITNTINLYEEYGYYANSTLVDLNNDRKFELMWEYSNGGNGNALKIFRDSSGVYKQRAIDFGLNTAYTSGGNFQNSFSVFDFDNDGFMDIFYNCAGNTNSKLFKNNGLINSNYLKIKLRGCNSAKDARGSKIMVYSNGFINSQYYSTNNNSSMRYNNKSESEIIHFGLSNSLSADSIIVLWPSGQKSKLINVQSNQFITIIENPNGNCGPCLNANTIYSTIKIIEYDTVLVNVTDTLTIKTIITGVNPSININTIKVFPNPTNTHITINYGNFSIMKGYQLRIENSLGQNVFQSNITQQSDYLDLRNWGGNGLYFVRIINDMGNTVDIRKIILQ